ncbi:MAG: LysM peptidoglycan-binding domain-containing protein [Alphaproteobacteria bacterium]|nr:LysM peptidoglycan-binding domain-containing protein [Alphaproteobacteria bacterium]
MQNKTPIVVLTGLGIVAAAGVAGLTRDQWMGHKPEVVATAPATEAPKAPEQPAVTPEAPKPAEPPATPAAEAPAEPPAATAPATTEQAATEAPATTEQPAIQAPAEQPAATAPATTEQPATEAPAEQPAATAPATTEQPAAEAPAADTSQQTAAAQPEQPAAGNDTDQTNVPAFDTVRVEKTGEAVIAGTAPAGSDVVVELDGKVIGETTANSDGAFVIVPDTPLPVGSGALTLEATPKGATEAISSRQSVAVIVPAAEQPQEALVAVVSPDQPTRVLQKPEVKQEAAAVPATTPAVEKPAKLVSIDAVDYDSAGNIVFSGQGNEGNVARVYIDNAFIGDAPVGAEGRWSFSATAQVTPGVHTLRVDGLDAEGKVLNRVEVPFVREQQNKVVEATQPPQTDGSTKTDAEPAQQPAAATPAKPKDGRVVIQPGNNLWRISRVLYGDGSKFTMLYEANKDQIRNPDRIYPGQVFKTPNVAATSESVDPKRRDQLKPEENGAAGQ